MSSSFEHRAEQTLLRAVRDRRQRRGRRRGLFAFTAMILVTAGFWLGRDHLLSRQPTTPAVAAAVETHPPAKLYREVSSRPDNYTAVHASPESPLVVVRTGDAPLPIRIDDRELFAVLPNAVIKISDNNEKELILPQ